ncbi:M6 family metalloprotease domain-containing protein [Flammeovirga pectinis]|uniref:M6 family metalloprotease domain-containing protein n=1 Tax=Flammeovirga pectinis TaxID=2494373 RepID=A0A3Q9FQL4_9BACT|nr:M6 family metalloprotease domain-containing protein [Flammeovirga pectinis]AZQ64146.1 M6 family metalloprotease domain-containing protein [Flammeovirga pectinis]
MQVFIKKLYTLLLFLGVGMHFLLAAPRNGEVQEFEQPDGSVVQIKLFGDDFYLRAESLDGYTLIRDEETEWICYAQLSASRNELVSTGIHYTGESYGVSMSSFRVSFQLEKHIDLDRSTIEIQRTQNQDALKENDHLGVQDIHKSAANGNEQHATPTNHVIGNYKGICILVDFSDAPAVWDKSTIEQMMNGDNFKVNGNYSSVKKYFENVSGGLVEYENVVFGYFRAPKSFATYDNMGYASGAREILEFVLEEVEEQGFDYSSLSIQNGKIQAINLMYTGRPRAWAKGMWHHKGTYTGFSADGVSSKDYNTSPVNTDLSIGTIIHENGHMLCKWPDLYKYSSSTGTSGIGNFCIMSGYGSTKNPIPPNPYFRWLAGWTTVTNISNFNGTISESANDNTIYKYDHPTKSTEFFMIEAVQKTGHSAYLPDEGLTIWHIDRTGNNQTWDHEVWLEHANNTRNTHSGACWHDGGNEKFNDTTSPNSNWLDGSSSELEISEVSAVANTMTFNAVGNGSKCSNNDVVAITVSPQTSTIFRNETVQLLAAPLNQCGGMENVTVTWSENALSGLFTATEFGAYTITANVNNVSTSVTVNVVEDPNNCSDPTVIDLVLTPSTKTIFIGEQLVLEAIGFNKCGGETSISPTWSSNAPNGIFDATQQGVHEVTVSIGQLITNSIITVLPENATLISNNEQGNISFMNTEWYAHDDGINGGSTVTPSNPFEMTNDGANGSDYSAKINYTLNKGSLSYNPFVAFGFDMKSNSTDYNLTGSSGISFYHKGASLHLQTLLSSITDYAHYQVLIPSHSEWTKVTLQWSDFDQPSWGRNVTWNSSKVTGFKWQKNGNTGDNGTIYIDEVKIEGLIFETPLKPCTSTGIASLAILPQEQKVELNSNVQFEVTGLDNCGDRVDLLPTWSLNAPNGLFTASSLGTFDVTVSVLNTTTNETISTTTSITVALNELPLVTLISPLTGVFDTNEITVSADASDVDGTITKVEFYANDTLVRIEQTAPYSFIWTPENGTYELKVIAYDNLNASAISATEEVIINKIIPINELPIVTLTSPSSSFYEHNNLTVAATASDADGVITKVEFYINDILFTTEQASPYSFTWNPENGIYRLNAIAFDNENASTVSEEITVTIDKEEIPTCPVWSSVSQYRLGDVVEYNGTNYTVISDWPNVGENPKYNIDNNWGWAWQEGGSCESGPFAAPQIVLSSDLEESTLLEVYPNPTSGKVRITIPSGYGQLTLFNLQGQALFKVEVINSYQEEVDLSKYGKGIFVVYLEINGQTITKKIVVR